MNVRETYVNPANRRQFQKAIEQKGFVQDYEVKFRKKDGTEIECLLTSTLRRDDNGDILGYQGILRDITERNRVKKELEKSYANLQKAVEATVKAIALTSEIRDPYTAGHQQRVAELACAIAKKMGLDEEQIETINVAGILHDIGKIYVPAEILSRPSKLNEIEMNMIRAHAQVGCDILEALELPWSISPIVLQHHERMDGSGYPAGISNGDILIEARILAVADVVEAMSSHRPYRPSLGMDAALNEIQQNRGKLYDPDVVDVCLTLFEEKEFKLKEPSRISIASSLI
jgi:putative nucleotidyltransferase with HDIG domain